MNQNIIIGILVAIVVLGGGYFLLTMPASTPGATATTTATTVDRTANTSTSNPAPLSPAAPIVVTDTNVAPSNSTAVVTGKVTPNGAPTSYWYEYGVSATLGSKTASQAIGSGRSSIASPGYITGLHANTQYYFRLVAQNALGTVSGVTNSFSTNNNPPGQGTVPAASTNVASDLARTSATLNAHVDPHSSPTTFWFEYGASNNFGSVTSFQSAGNGSGPTALSIGISELNPLTTYFFRVNAQNQYGTVNGATQSFTTKGPASVVAAVVNTLPATSVTNTKATVRGTVNPSGSVTSYWFEYGTDPLLNGTLKTTSHKSVGAGSLTTAVEANISGLTASSTYYARIVADNSGGTVRGTIQSFETTQ